MKLDTSNSSSSSVAINTETLQEAVYEMINMQAVGQEICSQLTAAINYLADVEISGNFLDLIIANMRKQTAETTKPTAGPKPSLNDEENPTFLYNDSWKKTETKGKGKGKDNPQSIALERILLKMKDLVLVMEVTQQLISRTQMDLIYTDQMIAKMALEMLLNDPNTDESVKKDLRKDQAKSEEMFTEMITDDRTKRELEAKKKAEEFSDGQGK